LGARLLLLPRRVKRLFVITVDTLICLSAPTLALYLRLGYLPPPTAELAALSIFAAVTAVPLFHIFGLYREIFRYSGWNAMNAIAKAVAIAAIPMILAVTVIGISNVPRTVGIIEPLLVLFLVGLARSVARDFLGGAYIVGRGRIPGRTRVAVYGAGAAGRQLCSALEMGAERTVVAYIDDDVAKQNHRINRLQVFAPSELAALVKRHAIEEVLLAIPSATRNRRNEIISSMREIAVRVQTLPGISDLASGKVQISDIRELGIEDLLGRETVAPDPNLFARNIRGKTVLVTGAGGSIGSEICRQIVTAGPNILLLVDSSEFALYSIHNELSALCSDGPLLVPLLASVVDAGRMTEITASWRPDTIYHAAAYKHVPLVEHNVVEGVRNNVIGTLRTAMIAADYGVSNFVLVSTDKAVRPTNVMGASKRLSELVLQALATRGSQTCFSMVRFGNVLGSSGSVVPLFRRQIAAGGPVTVTDPEMTRYFMTIPEAAQLVIQAGAMSSGGEVFVLDMGSPVRIVDLARNMIRLSGLLEKTGERPEGDIAISYVGLRPGEKLYEELLIGDNPEPTGHPLILKANEHMIAWDRLFPALRSLQDSLDNHDVSAARLSLIQLVPEFQPADKIVDFIYRERLRV
jgi:FlaA1/EpsC-like NDP-sugar epimerase